MKFEFKMDSKRAEKDLAKIRDALPVMMKESTYRIAKQFLDEVKAGAPRDIAGYPDMLELFEIKGDEAAFVVMPDPQTIERRLGPKDAGITLIFIHPIQKNGQIVSEAAGLLYEHNPWTMSTLPYAPKPKDATTIYRKVRNLDVIRRETELQSEAYPVRKKLAALGVKLETVEKLKARRDIAFEVLRAEYGIYRAGVAHWRPALRRVSDNLGRVMDDLWKEVLGGGGAVRYTGDVGSVSDIKILDEFQKVILGE